MVELTIFTFCSLSSNILSTICG